MPLPKVALLLLALPLLAACEGSAPPAAPDADTAATPVAAAPAATTSDAELAPLFGTFAADLAWCDGDAGGDGFPVTITATEFTGRENVCTIDSITAAGESSFEASLSCSAEGETVAERLQLVPIFAPSGEGLRITYVDRDGATTTLLRCN